MNKSQLSLVSEALKQAGFNTRIDNTSILAWLNRPIRKQEVEIVLDEEFEGIEFNLQCNSQCVLIKGD